MTHEKPQGFHVGQWGLWGWVETGLKSAAAAAGAAAFLAASGDLTIGGNPELAALIVMAGLTLNPLLSLPIRIYQKEIISIAFTAFSLLGHAGLLLALARDPLNARGYGIIFGLLYTLGELAKMRFLQVSGYSELGLDSRTMIRGVRGVVAAYVVLTVLLLL